MQRVGVSSFIRYQLPALLWMGIIYVASSIPGDDYPDIGLFKYDKLIHLSIYAILGILVFRAISGQSRFAGLARWASLWTVVFCILYGISDEFHQSFVPGRDMSGFDLLADAVGGLLSVAVVWYVSRRFTHLFRKAEKPD